MLGSHWRSMAAVAGQVVKESHRQGLIAALEQAPGHWAGVAQERLQISALRCRGAGER